MSAAPGCEFPNPCPVCGADDDHAEWRVQSEDSSGWMFGATHCPHPGERGHGTGCCCAGRSRSIFASGTAADAGPWPIPPSPLEQRVAALEAAVERLEHPLMVAESPPPELDEGALAEMRKAFEAAGMEPPRPIILPSSLRILDPETIRHLLRECVTVVKPGEVLFFTCGDPNYTPRQIREIQDVISGWLECNAPDVKALVLPHGEMAAAESGPD